MKVRLLVSVSSTDRVYGSGSIVDMAADEAKRYITAGLAVADGETPIEAAVAKPVMENATISPLNTNSKKEKVKPII